MRQNLCVSLIPQLLIAARLAGERIMEIYATGLTGLQSKEDSSPVTEADLASHGLLCARLAPLVADCPVVSEEDVSTQSFRRGTGRFWLIDPLDGTKEFIAGNGEFTVNIALVEDGRSVLGVVYAPAIDALYWGGAEIGAFRCTQGQTVEIQVAEGDKTQGCRVVASKSHLNEATQKFIDQLGQVSLIQAGSSLKFCRVAEGAADIYPRLGPTCEWDTAAAQAVLEGAGGFVLDLQGASLMYGKPEVLNPSFIACRDRTLVPAQYTP